MTDNTNNNPKEPEDPKKLRIKQESVVLVEFSRALQRKVETIRTNIGEVGKIGISEKEQELVNNIMRQGNMEGLIAGVATFVFLRRFPKYLRQRAAQRAAQQPSSKGGYKLDIPGGNNNSNNKTNSPFQNANAEAQQQADPYKPGIIWRGFQFTLDLTISALVGLNVTAYMMNREKMRKTLAEIPLMEGRSALSDHFCGSLVEEYQRQWKYNPSRNGDGKENENAEIQEIKPKREKLPPFDRKDILRNPQTETLKGLIEFTQNCKKRQAMERRIRQERGMGPNEPVEIPPPGVNSSEWNSDGVSDDDGFDSGDAFGGEKYFGGNNGGDDGWSQDDASSFVSDQEDSRK